MHHNNKTKSRVILVYGFSINEYDKTDYELDENVKIYNIPFYGDYNSKTLRYVGIQFGEIKSVFDYFHYSPDALQITKLTLDEQKKEQFDKKYGKITPQYQALIQNVYTSHYVSINMYCGYFVKKKNPSQSDYEENIDDYVEENIDDLEIVHVSHNITDMDTFFKQYIFIGKPITEYEIFDFSDGDNPGNTFYNILKTRYSANDHNIRVIFKPDVVNLEKIIAFIPEMCYCCT